MMGMIQITLRSDLCAASGAGFSSLIDTDVCYDAYGFPYIPARRIRGCLREAAAECERSAEVIDALFGGGSKATFDGKRMDGALRIGNGQMPDVPEMERYLRKLPPAEQENVPKPWQIVSLFTYVRGQTALENGVAKENSLRFTRVLKRNLPYAPDQQTRFFFPCELETRKEIDLESELEIICKALRHIGLHRTRGLGAVSCKYRRDVQETKDQPNIVVSNAVRYRFTIELTDALLMATQSSDRCQTYIPGTALLGALANQYLKKNGGQADERFNRLFLSGNVRFSNLYLADKTGRQACIPAPYFLCKIKSGDEDNDKLVSSMDQCSFRGKERKPMRDAMVERYTFKKRDVHTEMVYHHSRQEQGMLYVQTCVSKGQLFCGTLSGDDSELVGEAARLLCGEGLRLGRSKNAQYAGCRLIACEPAMQAAEQVSYQADKLLVFALESDAILRDEKGVGTVLPSEWMKALGLSAEDYQLDVTLTSMHLRTIHGYNAKRGLRNMSALAIGMGSVLTVRAQRDGVLPRYTDVGTRTAEGFGRTRLYREEETSPADAVTDDTPNEPENNAVVPDTYRFLMGKLASLSLMEDARQAAREYVTQHSADFSKDRLNAAFLGRLLRMLETSDNMQDMQTCVESIKTESKKRLALNLIKSGKNKLWSEAYWRTYYKTILQFGKYYMKNDAGNRDAALTGGEEA